MSKEKASNNLSETLSEILKSCDKEEELAPEIFAHMTDMAATDPSICMEVNCLDDKTAITIIKQSRCFRTTKINAISDIMGLSVFSWIVIGTKSQKVNGQVVHIPEDAKEAVTMISAMTLYLKIEKTENHFFEQELLPGMQDNCQELKRLFNLGGKEFGFHFFKLIHNMVTNYIGKAIADRPILESSLPFKTEVLSKLECSTFPYIKNEKDDNKQNKRKKQTLKITGSGKGPFVFTGNPREFFKITSRDSERSYNQNYLVDDYGKRICMNAMRYERCTKPNCTLSHTEHMEKITKWNEGNNIQLRNLTR